MREPFGKVGRATAETFFGVPAFFLILRTTAYNPKTAYNRVQLLY